VTIWRESDVVGNLDGSLRWVIDPGDGIGPDRDSLQEA
jgi:hypothetical protein